LLTLLLTPTLNCYPQQVFVSYFKQWWPAEMSAGKRPEEHVQIPERRTHCITEAERGVWCLGCPAHPWWCWCCM